MSGETKGQPKEADDLSESVSAAISELISDDDPFCRPDFDVVSHINSLFPTEQSLSQLEDVMEQVRKVVIFVWNLQNFKLD